MYPPLQESACTSQQPNTSASLSGHQADVLMLPTPQWNMPLYQCFAHYTCNPLVGHEINSVSHDKNF